MITKVLSRGKQLPVDILHNLENLLDMYEYPDNVVLVNEAIANAVDAFRDSAIKSGRIDITFSKKDNEVGYLSFHNNAPPMASKQFYGDYGYHKLSFSSKIKGHGIGFAGVGAKLLLVSKNGGEIITVTGKGKNEFIASKMYRTLTNVEFKTTEKDPLNEILEIPNYIHTFGTTYSVKLYLQEYTNFKKQLLKIIQSWWNYALLTKQIVVTIDGKLVSPWTPIGDKFKSNFKFKKENISAYCFITKENLDEELPYILYTVFGKRIRNNPIDVRTIKLNYLGRVFCMVDLSKFAKYLTSNKENFKKNFYVNDCMHHMEKGFLNFLNKHGITNDLTEPKNQMLKNELTKRLEDLFKTKEFSQLNPFLSTNKQKIPTLANNGDTLVSPIHEDVYEGRRNGDNLSKPGTGNGTCVQDKDANKTAKMKERHTKGLHLIYEPGIKDHTNEAIVSIEAGAVIIDTHHPFWLKCQVNRPLRKFNEMRIVIEALIVYKNDELEWDAKETLEKYRDMIYKTWI